MYGHAVHKLTVVAVLAVLFGTVGCAAPSPGTVTHSVTAPPSQAPTGADQRPAGVQAESSVPECSAHDLTISASDNSDIQQGALAGMSHQDTVWMFTNTRSQTCFMQGYPGITGLDAAGHIIFQAQRQEPLPASAVSADKPPARVRLMPEGKASALLSADSASCDHPTEIPIILVTAPDEKSSTRVSYGATLCPKSATVHPVVAGNTGGAL